MAEKDEYDDYAIDSEEFRRMLVDLGQLEFDVDPRTQLLVPRSQKQEEQVVNQGPNRDLIARILSDPTSFLERSLDD